MPPRQTSYVCPSGYEAIIRSRKTKDVDIITSDDPNADDRYLEAVIVQTLQKGPYGDAQFLPGGTPRVSDGFLMGDWWPLYLKHHELNYPDPFVKTFKCDGDQCGHTEEMKILLGDEDSNGEKGKDKIYRLRVRPLREEVAQQFKDKNQFEEDFLGKRLTFRLQTRGAHNVAARYIRKNPDERFTAMNSSRIVRVEGVGESSKEIREWVGSLEQQELDDLEKLLESYDCGVDWMLYPFCPKCDDFKEKEVFVDENFFTRGRGRRRRNSRR